VQREYLLYGGENGTLLVTEEKEGAGLDLKAIMTNIKAIQGQG